MSSDQQRFYFWMAGYVFMNLFSILFGNGEVVWLPLMIALYHFGRMTAQEEATDHDL